MAQKDLIDNRKHYLDHHHAQTAHMLENADGRAAEVPEPEPAADPETELGAEAGPAE